MLILVLVILRIFFSINIYASLGMFYLQALLLREGERPTDQETTDLEKYTVILIDSTLCGVTWRSTRRQRELGVGGMEHGDSLYSGFHGKELMKQGKQI